MLSSNYMYKYLLVHELIYPYAKTWFILLKEVCTSFVLMTNSN